MTTKAYLLARIDMRSGKPTVENVGIYSDPDPSTVFLKDGMWALLAEHEADTYDKAKTELLNAIGKWCPALLPFVSPR